MIEFILSAMLFILLFAYLNETYKCRELENTIDKLERKIFMLIEDNNG